MRIVYDITTMQPGCVILQAALGGTVPNTRFLQLFPSEHWLVSITPYMQCYPVTEEQLEKLSVMTKKAA
jgi:hypothetical protein